MNRPVAFVLVLAALAVAGAAHAGWGPDPVQVRPNIGGIPVVAACNDGGTGTFVAWQEGQLRVQHLLSTGDLDSAWPADGAFASDVAVERDFVQVIPDHVGGVYVCWAEGAVSSSLFVTRLDPDGHVAGGWPASGKPLGTVKVTQGRPSVIEDGAQGLFVAWTTGPDLLTQRLGTDGLGVGGWPDAPVVVAPSGSAEVSRFWPDLALGPDGGVFVSWATWSEGADGLYLRRLTSAAVNSSGWPTEGMYLGFFHPGDLIWMENSLRAPLLDIAPDARGGLFCIAGILSGGPVRVRLHRLTGAGGESPGWPVQGRPLPWYPDNYYFYYGYEGPDEGLQVHPDGQDGAMVESQQFYTDSPFIVGLSRCIDGGPWWVQMQGNSAGHEVVVKGDGGAFLAQCVSDGPYGPYSPNAFIAVDQSNAPSGWTRWSESHGETPNRYYGDIALAPAGDGGVVFFWSEHRVRLGLFARKFSTTGPVTAVDPVPEPTGPALDHVRFVAGTGVVAHVALGIASVRLELFDVSGRLGSSQSLDGRGLGASDVTLPGTSDLPSGLYFVRLVWGQSAAHGKVVVVR